MNGSNDDPRCQSRIYFGLAETSQRSGKLSVSKPVWTSKAAIVEEFKRPSDDHDRYRKAAAEASTFNSVHWSLL